MKPSADRQSFRVPRSRLGETHRRLAEPLTRAIEGVLFGGFGAGAQTVEAFEEEVAAAVERRYAVGVQSGTAGLFLALRAAGIGVGDEVITVANTDVSTVSTITHCGATPVFCDVRPDDFTIDLDQVEDLMTPRTRAVVPVDLYGHPADVRSLRALVEARGLSVIEDACLALGARDYGQPVGAFADVAVFSFNSSKPLGTSGNGGVVVTDDPALARQVRLLRGYGASLTTAPPPGKQRFIAEGYVLPIEAVHAAILRVKLPFLGEWTRRRREIAQAYTQRLDGRHVRLPRFRPDAEPTFRQFTVRVEQRDGVYEQMRERGVEVVLHYVPPLHRQPIYVERHFPGTDRLPVTEAVTEELLCLPVSPELTDEDVRVVVDTLNDLTRGASAPGEVIIHRGHQT